MKVAAKNQLDLKERQKTVEVKMQDKKKVLLETNEAVNERQESVKAEERDMKMSVIKTNEKQK